MDCERGAGNDTACSEDLPCSFDAASASNQALLVLIGVSVVLALVYSAGVMAILVADVRRTKGKMRWFSHDAQQSGYRTPLLTGPHHDSVGNTHSTSTGMSVVHTAPTDEWMKYYDEVPEEYIEEPTETKTTKHHGSGGAGDHADGSEAQSLLRPPTAPGMHRIGSRPNSFDPLSHGHHHQQQPQQQQQQQQQQDIFAGHADADWLFRMLYQPGTSRQSSSTAGGGQDSITSNSNKQWATVTGAAGSKSHSSTSFLRPRLLSIFASPYVSAEESSSLSQSPSSQSAVRRKRSVLKLDVPPVQTAATARKVSEPVRRASSPKEVDVEKADRSAVSERTVPAAAAAAGRTRKFAIRHLSGSDAESPTTTHPKPVSILRRGSEFASPSNTAAAAIAAASLASNRQRRGRRAAVSFNDNVERRDSAASSGSAASKRRHLELPIGVSQGSDSTIATTRL